MLFLLLPIRPLLAEDADAQNLVQQMSAAIRALDYQGSFIYEHSGQIDALRIFHEGGDHERERLISMSGPRSEVLRDGAAITCLQAGMPSIVFPNRVGTRLLPLVPDTRGLKFAKLYALSLGGEDRVAGYRARVVEMAARDAYRYGYRLWLEESTQLLLRSAVVDNANRTLEQFMFVALDVGAKPKESDLAPASGVGTTMPPDEVGLSGPPRWRIVDPPPGFAFVRGQRPALGPSQVEHQVYSDGIANVSVYIEPRDTKLPSTADSALTRGVLSVYTHSDGAWKITALGDVPRATVERMARSTAAVGAP